MTGPFDALGLPASGALTDDDVRSAWRRIAAGTHPDREDGGNPAAFAAAAAAYTLLRTATGRGEALADMNDRASGRAPDGPVPRTNKLAPAAATITWRIRHGRLARLTAKLLATTAAATLAVTATGWQPASAAVITGALTWLLLTGRHDLAAK